jgi:hypothetical protein
VNFSDHWDRKALGFALPIQILHPEAAVFIFVFETSWDGLPAEGIRPRELVEDPGEARPPRRRRLADEGRGLGPFLSDSEREDVAEEPEPTIAEEMPGAEPASEASAGSGAYNQRPEHVSPKVWREVKLLHQRMGRPASSALVKYLSRYRAIEEAITAAKLLKCSICEQSSTPKAPEVATTKRVT